MVIDMRNDVDNHKYSNWKVNYLFANYMFGKNLAIMSNIELMYMSLVALCQNAVLDQTCEKSEDYRPRILAVFRSCIDFYDVLFRNLRTGFVSYISGGRKPNAETRKNYLRMTKVAAFFENSGKKSLISTGSKRRDDINFKFMRMLLSRCDEFEEFVKFVHNKEIESHLDVVEFQYITILKQLITEAEERAKRYEEEEAEKANGSERGPRQMEIGDGGEEDPHLERLPSKPARKKSSFVHERLKEIQDDGLVVDEEEDLQQGRRVQGKMDEQTKKYLALVKKYQYEDEYDDTHEMGDMRNRRGQQNKKKTNPRRRDQEDMEDEDSSFEAPAEDVVNRLPVEQDEEESIEDIDPLSEWDRKQSSNYSQKDGTSGPLDRNAFRGAPRRGGRGSRGSQYKNNREYDRKHYQDDKKSSGARRENEPRDNERRPNDRAGDDYYEKKDTGSYRGYDDRRDGRRGQNKPQQGNRDTR